MTSKETEENCCYNTETEEETIALQKKRSRRVSFAETTAVHVFDRDDEYETPPDAANPSSEDGDSSDGRLVRSESDEIMELLQSDDESDADGGGGGDDDDDVVAVKSSFIRPIESPSPGSNYGSACFNDEDNFFGPVSMDFIKPGRLSDSAASDENHDITMDSTAFSLHFRSLARSDSGGDFKTPTGLRLAFDERTPGQISTATNIGDSMVMTAARKPVPNSSLSAYKVHDNADSDDMSLVKENPQRYDYGKLPPELDVLLAEGGKDVAAVPLSNYVDRSELISSLKSDNISSLHQNRYELLDPEDNRNSDIRHVTDTQKTSAEAISTACVTVDNRNDGVAALLGETTSNNSNNEDDDQVTVTPTRNQIKALIRQTNGMPFVESEEIRKDAAHAGGKFESPLLSTQSKLDHEKPRNSNFEGSVSSLLAKRRQIFRVSGNTSNDQWNSTPLAKEFFDEGSIKQVWSALSFTKDVSRLKRLGVFPFASTSKAEGNVSRLMPPARSVAENSLLGYRSKDNSINHVDAPVVCLEALFSNVAEDDREFKRTIKMGTHGLRTKEVTECASCTEIVKDVELSCLSPAFPSRNKSTELTGAMVSPAFQASQKKGLEHGMSNDNPAKAVSQSTESDSSLPEITFNDLKNNRATRMPDDSVFPSKNGVERKVSASLGHQGSPSTEQIQHDDCTLRLEQGVIQNKANVIASRTESCRALFLERKAEANMSFSDIEHPKGIAPESQVLKEGSAPRIQNSCPVTSMCSQTAFVDKDSESCALGSLSDDLQTASTLTRSTKALPERSMDSVAGFTTHLDNRPKELPIQVSGTPMYELYSSLLKDPFILADDANVHLFVGKDDGTSRYSQLTSKYYKRNLVLQKPPLVCDSGSSSSLKRKSGQFLEKAEGHNDEIASFQHNPKLHKDRDHSEEGSDTSREVGGDTTLRHWANVFTTLSTLCKQLLLPLIDKLDLAQIERLDDALVHLEKMKSYQLLPRDVCSQKAFESAFVPRNKRMVDTVLLLCRTVYGKAKLQLMHLKQDKLLNQVRQLNSGVQESEILLTNCRQSCALLQKDIQLNCFDPESRPTDIEDKSLVAAKISSLKKELEESDGEIKNFNKFFNAYFKVMEESNCTKTTVFVKDFLKKRVSSRTLRSELQLCEVESLKTLNGQQDLLFNHGGFMSQRFSVNSNSTSGLLISNKLNNSKIAKMFLNMHACTAFSSVLSGESVLTYTGLRTIAQETQRTNLLLHNLLDVIEEVELAMLELKNLTHSRFCQPSAEKLDLQLCFRDFQRGASITLTLDITCLNRGVYPSHVLPYEVQGRAAENDDSFKLILDDIRSAVRGLRCGYMRIMSLCRCVSKTIQASKSGS